MVGAAGEAPLTEVAISGKKEIYRLLLSDALASLGVTLSLSDFQNFVQIKEFRPDVIIFFKIL